MAANSSNPEYAVLKSVLRSLLVSNPSKCTVQRLCKDYKDMEGGCLPFRRMGYNSVEELLCSMPDTVRLYGSGIFAEVAAVQSEKSNHISYMISQQKSTGKSSRGPRARYIAPRRQPQQYPPRPRQPSMQMSNQQPNRPPPSRTPPSRPSSYNSSSYNSSSSRLSSSRPPSNYSNLNFEPDFEGHNGAREEHVTSSSIVKRVIPELYYEEEELEEEEEVARNENKYSPPSQSVDSFTIEYRSKVPVDVQNRLRKLIQEHPAGIYCSKLPTRYLEMYGQKLRYDKYGYRCMIAMCSDLPEIFHYTQPSSDDFLIFDKNVPLPVYEKDEEKNELPNGQQELDGSILSGMELNWNLGSMLIPSDVLCLSDVVPRAFLPKDVSTGEYLDICVAEIYDPSKFWVYMKNGPLSILMEELGAFFSAQSNKYAIPEMLIEEGLYCVTLYCDEFHRAVIINTLPRYPGQVKVLFIDYGTVGWVQSSQLYYLPKMFAKEPCQAVRARLSNIVPPVEGTPWSTEAITLFRKLVHNSELLGEVTHIDREDKIVEFYMADTTNSDDIYYVNDELVGEGLATYSDEPRSQPPVDDPNCKCLVRNFHLCPSFEEIEGGFAPSLGEINEIINLKISINHALPQYFNTKYRDDIAYHEHRFERINKNSTIPPPPPQNLPSPDFDYSIFPDDLVSEIHSLIDDKTAAPCKVDQSTKESPYSGTVNRKRISDLLKSVSDSNTESSSYTSCLSDRRDDSFSSTSSPLLETQFTSTSTNPFLNGSLCGSTNPFLSNPSSVFSAGQRPKPAEQVSQPTKEISMPAEQPLRPPVFPHRFMHSYEPKKLNPFATSWTHNCARREKGVQVGEAQIIEDIRPLALPLLPVVRKIRTPPGFEATRVNNGMMPPAFVPGYMQQQFNYPMQQQPQFYQQRFPCQQQPSGFPPRPPPYGMPMPPGPPMGYPCPQQINDFGNYMSSALHGVMGHPFFMNAPIMRPQGFVRPPK